MSRPRRPSLREALAPVFARRDDREEIERLRRALLGAPSRRVKPEVLAAVRDFRIAHPTATPTACARSDLLRFRRQEILDAVRALDTAGNRFPSRESGREDEVAS